MSDESRREHAEIVKKAQIQVYWGEYSAVMDVIRRLEKRTSKRWGGGIVTPVMGEAACMKQLRQALEALEVGFE